MPDFNWSHILTEHGFSESNVEYGKSVFTASLTSNVRTLHVMGCNAAFYGWRSAFEPTILSYGPPLKFQWNVTMDFGFPIGWGQDGCATSRLFVRLVGVGDPQSGSARLTCWQMYPT